MAKLDTETPAADDTALLLEVRELLASDAFAVTFQTLGSYRSFLVTHIKNSQAARAQLAPLNKDLKGGLR